MTPLQISLAVFVPIATAICGFFGVWLAQQKTEQRLKAELQAQDVQAHKERKHAMRVGLYLEAIKCLPRAAGFIPRLPTLPQKEAEESIPLTVFAENLRRVWRQDRDDTANIGIVESWPLSSEPSVAPEPRRFSRACENSRSGRD